jgi:hypothetical protein
MSLRSGKLPFLGSEDELFDHTTILRKLRLSTIQSELQLAG